MTGLCILDAAVAHRMRPDLWQARAECFADFESKHGKTVASGYPHPGAKTYQADIEGIGRVKVMACSPHSLSQRIEWLTGLVVTSVDLDTAPVAPDGPTPRSEQPRRQNGDQYPDVVTKEPGRTCGACEFFSSRGSCIRPALSGIELPAANAQRRCLGFHPLFGTGDNRKGAQLWPELKFFKESSHGCV